MLKSSIASSKSGGSKQNIMMMNNNDWSIDKKWKKLRTARCWSGSNNRAATQTASTWLEQKKAPISGGQSKSSCGVIFLTADVEAFRGHCQSTNQQRAREGKDGGEAEERRNQWWHIDADNIVIIRREKGAEGEVMRQSASPSSSGGRATEEAP